MKHLIWLWRGSQIVLTFKQSDYQIYWNLEDLLLKACRGQDFETELDFVYDFYTMDVKKDLQTQLPLLRAQLHDSDTSKLY